MVWDQGEDMFGTDGFGVLSLIGMPIGCDLVEFLILTINANGCSSIQNPLEIRIKYDRGGPRSFECNLPASN